MWHLWVITATILLTLLWRKWGQNFLETKRCLRGIPGPKPWPLIGNVLYFGFDFSDYFYKSVNIWKTYGIVVQVWIGLEPIILLTDPRDVEVILSDTKNIDKGFPYGLVEPWLGKGLLTSTGEKWHKHRKIITPTFHFKVLEQFTEIFDRQGDVLISNLNKEANKKSFDVSPYIDLYTQDVICESAMGVNINAQKKDESSATYVNAVKRQTEYIVQRTMRPWLFLDFLFRISPLGRKQAKTLSILHNTTTKVIAERKKLLQNDTMRFEERIDESGRKKKYAFLDLLLISSEQDQTLSDTDIREEVDTFMFEGHDTTSRGICFALYELSKNQDIQERIFKELQTVMGSELNLALENLNDLKYLECVIKEALRLYPSVPFFSRKLKHNVELKSRKQTIPKGCTAAVVAYGVHRHPEFFPHPEVFDPDNFSPERVQGRHAYAYIPFSAGPRNCIGQKFALLEMKSIMAKIIWNFRVLPDPLFEPHFIVPITLSTSNGIKIKLSSREII